MSRILQALGIGLAALLVTAHSAGAQSSTPNVVEFRPSADHSTVTSYELSFYRSGGLDPYLRVSVGKPAPQADGLIRVDYSSLIGAWPVLDTQSDARVAAYGPGGVSVSTPSNTFTYSCSFGLGSSGQSFAATGGSSSVTVTTTKNCGWKAVSSAAWVTVTTGTSVVGPGAFTYTVASNTTSSSRSATITVGNAMYVITQNGTSSSGSIVTVAISSPANGATFSSLSPITVSAAAATSAGTVSQVQFYANGSLVGTDTTSPYSVSWTPAAGGSYMLEAVATNSSAVTGRSAPVGVTINTSSGSTARSTYLSDLTWTSMTNGWGPAERDRSNGGTGATDGRTITLNGQTYAKGLGVHAASDIRYALDGTCTAFMAEIGVDDEEGSGGSVVFQVWADGVRLYTSPLLTGASATVPVNVNITGRRQLQLVVSDGGNGNAQDHADWAAARIVCGSAAPSGSSGVSYLSDAVWASATNGWGPVERDRSNGEAGSGDGRTITLNARTYAKGLGVHGNSTVKYALNSACTMFRAAVGVDDEVGSNGSVVFEVWADGTKLYDSGAMTGATATKELNVDITSRRELSLIVTDGGNGNPYDHASWGDARVECTTPLSTVY